MSADFLCGYFTILASLLSYSFRLYLGFPAASSFDVLSALLMKIPTLLHVVWPQQFSNCGARIDDPSALHLA